VSQIRGRNEETTLADFTPTKYQDEFLRGDKRYLGFVSGVGAGKTYAGIIRTFLNMEKWNPGEMGAIVAPTRQMIVNVIIPEMRELGLLDKWDYNSSYSDEPGLHSPNGARALILSADNKKTIERLRGLNLSWGWIDERTAVDDRAKEILLQRLRTGNYRNLFETTTPKGKDGTYEFYVETNNPEKRQFGDAIIYEAEDRLAIVGVPTDANPNTPDDYKEAMQADMPEDIRAQEIQGQFVEIGAGIFMWNMLEFVAPSDVPQDWAMRTVIYVDPAVTADAQAAREQDSDYWGVTVLQVPTHKNLAFVVDTARRRGMTLSEGCDWISAIANGSQNDPTVVVESNQSQRWLRQELGNRGVNALPEQNTRDKEDRILDLSIPLENGTVKFVDWNTEDEHGNELKPGQNHPYQELVSELLAFPDGAHDDLVDSLHGAVSNAPIQMAGSILGADAWGDRKKTRLDDDGT